MTDQEQQLLNGLIQRVNSTQLPSKDAEAEQLLANTLGRNPDALYILAQTVLVQQFALDNSQQQLAALRVQLQQAQQQSGEKHGSFLGNLFGLGGDSKKDEERPVPPQQATPAYQNPTGYQPVHNPVPPQPYGYPPQQGYPQGGLQGYPTQPPAGYGYGGYPPPAGYGAPMGGGIFGGGGGFLAGAAQTAAGVVAGEMAFRAIEDIFHGFGEGGHNFSQPTEVVNNYYEDRPDHDGGFGDRLAQADNYNGGISPDIEDRRGDSRGFFSGSDDSNDDQSAFADDNSSDDNSGYDDSSSFDDNGSDFGGGSDDSSY